MNVSTSDTEQNPAVSKKLEKKLRFSLQPEKEVIEPPDLLETVSDETHASENQVKDLLHSPTPCKKQRRHSVKEGAVSYSSVLSLMPSRLSLRTLISPQVRLILLLSECVYGAAELFPCGSRQRDQAHT
jgi:hypothetical protein